MGQAQDIETWDLHYGFKVHDPSVGDEADGLEAVRMVLRRRLEHVGWVQDVFVDGDGFEAWGEPLGTVDNPGMWLHVVVRFTGQRWVREHRAVTLLQVLERECDTFAPDREADCLGAYGRRVFAALTRSDVWSSDDGALDFVPHGGHFTVEEPIDGRVV